MRSLNRGEALTFKMITGYKNKKKGKKEIFSQTDRVAPARQISFYLLSFGRQTNGWAPEHVCWKGPPWSFFTQMCTLLHKHIQNIFAMIDIMLFPAEYGDSFADSSRASWLVTPTEALASCLSWSWVSTWAESVFTLWFGLVKSLFLFCLLWIPNMSCSWRVFTRLALAARLYQPWCTWRSKWAPLVPGPQIPANWGKEGSLGVNQMMLQFTLG